jgi:hypothetical protein
MQQAHHTGPVSSIKQTPRIIHHSPLSHNSATLHRPPLRDPQPCATTKLTPQTSLKHAHPMPPPPVVSPTFCPFALLRLQTDISRCRRHRLTVSSSAQPSRADPLSR